MSVDTKGNCWTFGCEFEMADWDTTRGWEGFGRSQERNIVNSNGIAVDPQLISYKFGGEFNTTPSDTIEEQGELFSKIMKMHPNAKANWRCGFHVHIRVPELCKSLTLLKKLAKYINANTAVYDLVDPLPLPSATEHADCFKQARKRYNWMRMSHFTKIPDSRVEKQLKAKSLEEFFKLEVPMSKSGKPLWHAQPRAAVNLRQLLQTDTIEFRHFPQAETPEEVINGVSWCKAYLLAALDNYPAVKLFNEQFAKTRFPMLTTIYVHWQEQRWLATTPTKNPRATVEANIAKFLKEDKEKGIVHK